MDIHTQMFVYCQVFLPGVMLVVTSWIIFWIKMSDAEKVLSYNGGEMM